MAPKVKHKQKLVSLRCGVRSEVDEKIADMIEFLNSQGVETRHSCQGTKKYRGYVSMFASESAREMAHWLIEHHGDMDVVIEIGYHPHGYENLTIRFRKQNIQELTGEMRRFFAKRRFE